jgi:hypothetical protein
LQQQDGRCLFYKPPDKTAGAPAVLSPMVNLTLRKENYGGWQIHFYAKIILGINI